MIALKSVSCTSCKIVHSVQVSNDFGVVLIEHNQKCPSVVRDVPLVIWWGPWAEIRCSLFPVLPVAK